MIAITARRIQSFISSDYIIDSTTAQRHASEMRDMHDGHVGN